MAVPPVFTSGQVLTAAQMNAVGSWLVASGTFTTASTVNIDNVFTADYEKYFIVMRYSTSGGNDIFAQFRAAGSAAATNYNYQQLSAASTTVSGVRSAAQTSFFFAGRAAAVFSECQWLISGPNLAEATTGSGITPNPSAGNYALPQIAIYSMNHSTATAYDGIGLSITTSTMTGTYAIYGLRD